MPEIRTKSIDDWISQKDGYRLFVTRYWPRGCPREECDEWLPNLAPSESLLKDFQADKISWATFRQRYSNEMLKGYGDEEDHNPRMRNSGQKYFLRFLQLLAESRRITLLCHCAPEEKHCHRHLLKELLEKQNL